MQASMIPADFVQQFQQPGSTVNISNLASPFPEDDERFMYEGEIRQILIVDDTLVVDFAWLAAKHHDGKWRRVTELGLHTLRHSLALFQSGVPEPGRFLFLPREPIVHEQILFISADYVGPTGRRPLRLEDLES